VRIWLSGENEFKSFKTEQGWLGKKNLNGVIEFISQKELIPGNNVKFGIKTTEKNPVINWKAVNAAGDVISTQSTKITISESTDDDQNVLNQLENSGIKEESIFRFIPEKPGANSDFRVVGENFVPNQPLDFYISGKLIESVNVDKDGKILFTSRTPITQDGERTEFVLQDAVGKEKLLSIRVPILENREIPDVIKLSLGNTPQQVKRGDVITLEGMATPNTTLTITCKHPEGDIIAIDTIQVGFNGKWSYDNLFGPELDLGIVSIEIDDGKSTALRNIEVISAKLINIFSEETVYMSGETVTFEGSAIPNNEMSIVLEDSIGAEIFSRTVSVGESGNVSFNIEIPRGSVEGTYVLSTFQGNESGVTIFGVGQEPEPILILRPQKLNFSSEESPEILIQGPPNAQVSLILIDSADREKFSDTINLGPDGKEFYKIVESDLPNGAFTLNAKRGESTGSAIFTVGLTTGSGTISLQTTRDEYTAGEQVLILGNTGSINVLLDIMIYDSDGSVIKKIETFSDRFGVFKIDNFRIPSDAISGEWKITAKSGGNFKDTTFEVVNEDQGLIIVSDKSSYSLGELVNFNGSGARMSASVTLKIFDSEGEEVDELTISAKSNGEFLTMWQIPTDLEQYHPLGNYEVIVDDGWSNTALKFKIE